MTVLCYHSVDAAWESPLAVPPTAFDAQCRWLRRRRRVVPVDHLIPLLGTRPARRYAALTFDDGFDALFDHALPTLGRHGLPATVFLVARTLVEGVTHADWVSPPPRQAQPVLGLDRVLEMQDAGVSFASHSWAHHDLRQLGEAECRRDLRRSREALEDLLGRPVPLLAYPYGFHAPHVRRAAERAGYSHAFTLPAWGEPSRPGPYAVPRAGIYRGNRGLAFRTKLTRPYLAARTNRATATVLRRRRAGAGPPRS